MCEILTVVVAFFECARMRVNSTFFGHDSLPFVFIHSSIIIIASIPLIPSSYIYILFQYYRRVKFAQFKHSDRGNFQVS